jgi:hypothetical protein
MEAAIDIALPDGHGREVTAFGLFDLLKQTRRVRPKIQ